MRTQQPHRLPGYQRQEGDGPMAKMAPHLMHHDGDDYMVVHASGLTTGVVVRGEQDVGEGLIAITTWAPPSGPGRPGLALTFTPDEAMIDLIIDSLTRFRDARRDHAAAAAAALLRKVAGK